MSDLASQGHSDAEPLRDWLVTFARKAAEERDYSARHPGHVFYVMLNRDEAEGLLQQIRELVAGERAEAPLARLTERARHAKAQAAAPEYDEEAIRDALWAVVDEALAATELETQS